ncbi:hypothetical protein [uncultured Amnibacterium sp.]|uniref:hypothetical protein n=1 Tax=uncultured Amnibacterium sp. TaxID=1631851 RepID=UPI0035CC6C5D
MRFVAALVAFVVAAAMMAVGIAQRTVLLPPDRAVASAQVPAGAHYVVIPGSALKAHPGQQHLTIHGDDAVFAAYGRTGDVMAWLSGQRYTRLGFDDVSGTFARPVSAVAPVVAGLRGGAKPDPNGSDLWLDQRRTTGSLTWNVNLPKNLSLIVASDGRQAAPNGVSITWPVSVSTPFATPLIVGGSLLLLVGLILYILALLHLRRRRGPRRKAPPRMPRPPQPPRYKPAPVAVPVASRGRRAAGRPFTAVLALGTAGLLLSGCAPLTAATEGASAAGATPSPTEKTTVPVTPVAVTTQQAVRIVRDAARVERAADRALDATRLEARFAGPALALRKAAYTLHDRSTKFALPQALPVDHAQVQVVLPQATAEWPRTLFAVDTDISSNTVPPLAITLVQQTPRSPYQVQYLTPLQPGAVLPALPNALTGAARVAPDTTLLKVAPGELAIRYGRVLRSAKTHSAVLFDSTHDSLQQEVGLPAKEKLAKALGKGGKLTYSDAKTDPASVVALATAASGALVSVSLSETWTAKPAKAGAKVKPSGATQVLSNVKSTTKGIALVHGMQLLFSVPPAGASGRVVLLGYAQGLISAKEL